MKKIALIICFCVYAHIFAQVSKDSLYTFEGKVFAGEYVRIDQKSIYFKIEGSANASTLPKDKIDKVFLKSGEAVNIITGKIINLKETKRLEEEKRKKCEFNQKERIIVFPFKEDKIGRAQEYVQNFKSDCYTIISNYDAYKFFDTNDISYNDLSDYDIINMSTALNINRVYIGELYIINQPFKQPYLLNEKFTLNIAAELKKQQELAVKNAGSFLYETVYYIDTISRERVYIKTDNFIKKW
jgi:hypothetical protein